jgi:hypothetical protein
MVLGGGGWQGFEVKSDEGKGDALDRALHCFAVTYLDLEERRRT